jgi:hypothetical protein
MLALLVLASLAVVFSFHAVFVAYPRYEMSVYRYSLWSLRDSVWDRHFLDGRLPPGGRDHLSELGDDASVMALIRELEDNIRRAPDLDLLSGWMALRAMQRVPSELAEQRNDFLRRRRADSQAVAEIRNEATDALHRYLSRGSVLGWTLMPAKRFWLKEFRRLLDGNTKPRQVCNADDDGDLDTQFNLLVAATDPVTHEGTRRTPLSSCV